MVASTLSLIGRIGYDIAFDGGEYLEVWLPITAAFLVLAYAIDYLRGFTRTKTISLSRIDRVVPIPGNALSQPRLIAHYRTHDGTARRRITLPSRHLSYTDGEFERATRMLDTRGLDVDRSAGAAGSAKRARNATEAGSR
jgi:hypothetical protein